MKPTDINAWVKQFEEAMDDTEFKSSKEVVEKVMGYSKSQRIVRLIEVSMKPRPTALETLEMTLIQEIRQENGEIDEVKRTRTDD